MKQKAIKIVAVIMILSIFFTIMSFPASAAVSTSTAYAKNYSCLLVQKTAEFKNLTTNKITVMNKGTVAMYVYINNSFCAEISPGREYTYSQYGIVCKKFNVKVYAVKSSLKKQEITIKTTSGTLK